MNVIPLARSAINNTATRLDAALALADLIALLVTFLSAKQRYIIVDKLRNIADVAERVDVTAHRSLRTDLGGNA
ncbi:MAG: hypothetical protein ACXVOI_09515 [Tumebacillaceae bacterium]